MSSLPSQIEPELALEFQITETPSRILLEISGIWDQTGSDLLVKKLVRFTVLLASQTLPLYSRHGYPSRYFCLETSLDLGV